VIQVKALKAFQSRYGFMRPGDQFWSEESYVKQLQRVGSMIEILRDDDAPITPAIEPQRHQAFPAAPLTKGKVSETELQPPLSRDPNSEAAKDDGAEKPLPSSRAGRRSQRRTSTGVEPDAK